MADHAASPQLEDGYTKIANELLDAIVGFGFSARQWAVLFAIIRKTYGYNKKVDDIGLSQISKLTGIFKTHLSKTVRELADMRVIIRSQGEFGHKLSVNKNYKQWTVTKSVTPVTETVTPTVTDSVTPTVTKTVTPEGVTNSVTGGVTELVSTPVTETVTTKDNHTKDNLPKEKNLSSKRTWTSESFDAFWSIWPDKTAKKKARDAFQKINPDSTLLARMISAVEAQKLSPKWIEEGGRFIPMAVTWLNGQRWEDEIKPAVGSFTPEQQRFIDAFNANIGGVCQPITEWSQKISDLTNLALAGKWNAAGWVKYFVYVRDKCQFKGQMSFEWLVTRDNLVKVKRGDFEVQS